jgi:hypothetical protein
MTTIASAHSPVITERSLDAAFALMSSLPATPAPPVPDQVVLEAIVAQMSAAA